MARRFVDSGATGDFITFTASPAIQSLDAGPLTIVSVLKLNGNTYTCPLHVRQSGGTVAWWQEIATTTLNAGQAGVARAVGTLAAADGWCVVITWKDNSGTERPWGQIIPLSTGIAGTPVQAVSTMADGVPPGAGAFLQVGRWGTDPDFANADIAAEYVFGSILTDPERAAFITHAAIMAKTPAWAVALNQASVTDPVPDLSADGTGDSVTITAPTMSIVADPVGFFAGGGSTVNAVMAAALPAPVATALATPRVLAVLAATLPAPVATLVALPRVHAVLAATLPAPVATALALPRVHATMLASLPAPVATALALPRVHAVLAATLPAPVATMVAHVAGPVHFDAQLPAPVATMVARPRVHAVLAAMLPAPVATIVKDQTPYATAVLTPGAGAPATLTPGAGGATLTPGAGSAAALAPGAIVPVTFTAGAVAQATLSASTR